MKKCLSIIVLVLFATLASAQVTQTVNVTTAGTLSTLANAYLSTVTNLTVTGNIDQRDVACMRDQMPLLAVLDISGVSIKAYDIYPANEMPAYSFYNADNGNTKYTLTAISLPAGITSIGEKAFSTCTGLTGSLTIPGSVALIGNSAFYDCVGLTGSLILPASVTSIGDEAFSQCSGLTGNLIIPGSVTFIGNGAFTNSRLTLVVDAFNPNYVIVDDILYNKALTTLIECSYTKKSTISIPGSVASIGSWAFGYCTGLTGTLIIPGSVTSIGDNAFQYCSGLTGTLTIPGSVTTIGNAAFAVCTGLTSVTIPGSVTSIGRYAFIDCTHLTSIYDYATSPVDLSNSFGVFNSVDKNKCTLYVPQNSLSLYREANQWKDFVNIIQGEMPNGIVSTAFSPVTIVPTLVPDGFRIRGIVGTALLSLYNSDGVLVVYKKVISDEFVNIMSLPAGVYFAKIKSAQATYEDKLVKL